MAVIQIKYPQELTKLRRIALSAQGLLQIRPFGCGLIGANKTINHLGYVQIDTISVVERAHNHVLHSRVPDFEPDMINQLLLNKDVFEYWSHAAAFLPVTDFRFSLPYKHAIKSGRIHWFKNHDRKLMNELLNRIRLDGPIRSRDLDANTKKLSGWWEWKPAKKALEQLYMEGDIMVSDRKGFQKTYDLTERVLPSWIDSRIPGSEEFASHILDQQLRCHGIVSLKGLTYLRRSMELRNAVKKLVNEKLAQQTLEQVRLSDGEIFLLEKGALENSLPKLKNRMLILSPFDNCVIQRERLKSLFQYDYRLECYVPAAKRKYGYFCLPILYRDKFIGLMDCKAHRKIGSLEIKLLRLEPHNFDQDQIISAFVDAIKQFGKFQNCETVSLTTAHPKNLIQPLRKAFKLLG